MKNKRGEKGGERTKLQVDGPKAESKERAGERKREGTELKGGVVGNST